MNTIQAKLIAFKEELGGYITYVFQDVHTGKYIMCTKFVNWNSAPLRLWTRGYLTYKEIIAGRDTWYDAVSDSFQRYRFEGFQFINFVPQPEMTNNVIMM